MKPLHRKDQIRLKAQTLFRERGYSATSMRDLAEGLGIEAASLYNHISSKEEILQGICFGMADFFFAAVEPIAQSDATPKQKLLSAIEAHLGVIVSNLDAAAVFLHEWRHLGEPFLGDFKLMRRRYEKLFVVLIETGVMAGDFRTIDPRLAARTILSATNWSYESYNPHGTYTTTTAIEEIAGMLVNGIATT